MKDTLVFDVGMHVGQDTAYYLNRGFNVIAVEANPLLAKQSANRFKEEIATGTLVIENVGISDHAGNAEFWICDEMLEWSSFNRDSAARRGYKHHSIQVPCTRLTDLIQKYGMPYYMKIDIEGYDQLCLSQLSNEQSPLYISVESYGEQAVNDLVALGYTSFKTIDQICFRTLENPPTLSYSAYWSLRSFQDRSLYERNAYLSRFVGKIGGRWLASRVIQRYRIQGSYVFENGASGPFAETTPGRWKSAADSISAIKRFDEWFRATGQPLEKRWFDVHARK